MPKKAVQKAIDYRWWLERFNSLDANIPGYDYQYPVTIEGVLGYNNAIILTQPMHLQDTKWLRSPYLAYGQLLSAGNSSQSSAFLDNPGNRNNWNNHYGQYLAEAGYEAFNVIGGGAEVAENFAYYFGHDATGQLEHYGNHIEGRDLIAYRNNYMTGNDADTISMHAPGTGTWKAHGENAYVWAAADAAAKLYEQLGNTEQAKYYRDLADKIKADVLELMWCEECQKFETYAVRPTGTQHNANQPQPRQVHRVQQLQLLCRGPRPRRCRFRHEVQGSPQGLLQRQGVPDLPVLHRQPGPQPGGQRFEQLLEHQLHRAAPSV